jgi:hypothetical protein
MADNVAVVFSAQIGQLIDGVAAVKESILSIAEPIAAVQESLGAFGEAFAAAFAVEKIAGFFEHFAELGTQTQQAATLLGIGTDKISGLDIAAKASGGSLEGLVQSMERLGASLANAEGGSEKAKAGLQALGISAKEFQALSPQKQLEELAEKFSRLKDGIDKDAIAMAIMGRAGAQMIPIFNEGAEGLREFQAMAERTGTAMSKDVKNGFVATHHALIELGKSFEGVGIVIAQAFKPAFDGLVKILIDLNEYFVQSVNSGGLLKSLMNGLALGADALVEALAFVVAGLEMIWSVGKAAIEALAVDFNQLGKIMYAAMTFDLAGIKTAWADMMAANGKVSQQMAGEISTSMKNLESEIITIFGSSAEKQVAIAQNKTARLKMLNKDEVAAAMAAAQEQIKIADMQYTQTAEKLNSEAKLQQLTEKEKTQALLAALDARYDAEMDGVEQEKAIGGLSKAQHQKILDDELQMDQKYAADRQKIMDQAAEAEAKTWKAGADQVAGAFNSQLKGLLAGTTSFSQAMKNISSDLALKMIQDADKWAIEWIANQLRAAVMGNALKTTDVATTATTEAAKTTAVTTGVAARTTAETTGATAGVLAQIGNAFAVISADAAKTFAGIFAFLSPTLGPAAAGPATAGAAAVEASAMGMAVPGLAVGTDMVLSGGLAYLHSGEAVQPASVVGGGYSGAQGGGSGQFVFAPNLSAMDTTGLQALINKMMPQLARALSAYQNLNPSTT